MLAAMARCAMGERERGEAELRAALPHKAAAEEQLLDEALLSSMGQWPARAKAQGDGALELARALRWCAEQGAGTPCWDAIAAALLTLLEGQTEHGCRQEVRDRRRWRRVLTPRLGIARPAPPTASRRRRTASPTLALAASPAASCARTAGV